MLIMATDTDNMFMILDKKTKPLKFCITPQQDVVEHTQPMTGDFRIDLANTIELIDTKREPDAIDEMFVNHTGRKNIRDAVRWTECFNKLSPLQFNVFQRDQEMRDMVGPSLQWRVCSGIGFDDVPVVLLVMEFKYYDDDSSAELEIARVHEETKATIWLMDEDEEDEEEVGMLRGDKIAIRGENHGRTYRHIELSWNFFDLNPESRQRFVTILNRVKEIWMLYGIEVE
jgi:hypothetical protein